MNAEFVGRHYDIDDNLRSYAEQRLEAAERFADDPAHAHVAFTSEGHRCIVDIQFSHRFGTLHATEEATDMRDAANLAFDKLDKQLRRSRKRFVAKKRKADHQRVEAEHWPVEVMAGESLRQGQTEVLKSSKFEIHEMDMDRAVAKLEESRNQFLIFRHAETGLTTVLYKRRDGNYGLVSPHA